MRLEPIYLAPCNQWRPSRRSWLVASGAFVTGALAGTLGTRLVARSASAGSTDQLDTDELRELQYLHECCSASAPLLRLESITGTLYDWLGRRPDDRLLWYGLERLAGAVLSGTTALDQRYQAWSLLTFLASVEPTLAPTDEPVQIDKDALRRVARRR